MRKYLFIVIALCPFVFQACRNSQPSGYRGMPKEYNLCYEEIYGRCYDSIPYAVVALDLYSEGLELDEEHHMRGTGYNLYISDIFVPERTTADSLKLAVGEYKSDTTGEPFTFLPGRNWEGTPSGMYLLNIENDLLLHIQVLDSGYMTVRDTTNGLKDVKFTLYYKNTYGYRATYETHFQGAFIPWQKK